MSEEEINRRKRKTDELAGALLGLDADKLKEIAEEVFETVGSKATVVICGGAGSGKTETGRFLADLMDVPAVDFDQLIEGGWTEDQEKYEWHLWLARHELWERLPSTGGWVVEHVEACSTKMLKLFKPQYALLLNPGVPHLKAMAEAREHVSGQGNRTKRALQSGMIAKEQFDSAAGSVVIKESGWALKELK